MQEHMEDPALQAFATSLEIEVNDLEQFFSILSSGGKRQVDLESFVVACIKMRGSARSMDLFDLLLAHRDESEDTRKFEHYCREEFERLHEMLKDIVVAMHKKTL